MAGWYLDEGLYRLRAEWWQVHPGATVYTIGDLNHSTNPDVSQHAPDTGGPAPGDDRGEVDAADFMPGKGVTAADLNGLFRGLVESRDPRILYVIWGTTIVSSTVQPWIKRPYRGTPHGHVHVSVNDRYDANTADWKWEADVPREVEFTTDTVQFPILQVGDDDDVLPGYNSVVRAQVLANLLDASIPDVDVDGVYGARTAAKIGRAVNALKPVNRLDAPQWRILMGVRQGKPA
jgi:hypothetical protein